MKALVYDGPETLEFRDVSAPIAQAGDHLIEIAAVGICGSDMHAYLGHDERRPAPLILGHEAAGVIVGGPRDGERVTINPLVTCGICQACQSGRENLCASRQIISMPPREGAFAQYVTMPARNLVSVPDDVDLTQAALVEPLAVGWHAVRLTIDALHPSMDRRALVIGGGAIGVAVALALRAFGIDDVTIVEPNDARRTFLVETCDFSVVANATASYPMIIDAVGYATTRVVGSELIEPGGVITHVGLGDGAGGLDIRRMTLQEVTFIGTYTYSAQDFIDCAYALFSGDLGPINWIQLRPLSEGASAFSDLRQGLVREPKIVLKPWA
jgi:L-gulonate 5-dehydrogenase